MVGKRNDAITDDLAGFVALAGDNDDVASLHHRERGRDGFRAVADLARAGSARENFSANGLRTLAPWVIVGHYREVRLLDRDAAHERPFALVAIAAAAKDANETAGREWTAGVERRR